MASPRMHPRRTSPSPHAPRAINTADQDLFTLKKGSTFHSPSSPSGEHDPVLNIPSLPQRSSTTLRELEDVVAATPSDRITRVIGAVDRSFSNLQSFAADPFGRDESPIPDFMVTGHAVSRASEPMDTDEKPKTSPATPMAPRKHHTSDSGIGSTVSSEAHLDTKQDGSKQAPTSTEGSVKTGINGVSGMAPSFSSASQHALSEYACRQIQKHIILPIVREEKLKNFHPLVSGLPYRIARKEITCLRDLEKVLLWLAPKYSVSKISFLFFCETTIQCLHTAVDHLNDRDQRRPTDRPYTNGYFVDLVEQVRQYAAQLAATRSRMASDEQVELIGGLGHTGRVAELVRTKDGRSVSLRTGEEISEEYKQGIKRSSLDIEEELERSMARRRKNAPVEKQAQKCNECDKVFKRPCDLTKHEKTHSRPWKCSEVNCKYHEYGWPTEKERDRHVNDKHSAAPLLFKCKFHPCPYESKRESNCKQHMEKAHGWTYVKSKSNGKSTLQKPGMAGKTPPTPVDSLSGSEHMPTPSPHFDPLVYDTPSSHDRHGSVSSARDTSTSGFVSPEMALNPMFGPPNTFWAEDANDFTDSIMGFGADSSRQWGQSPMANPNVAPSVFNEFGTDDESIFGQNFDWSNMSDMTALNMQLATPALSVEPLPAEVLKGMQVPSLSPHAQALLYSPYSMASNETPMDEGYCGEFAQESAHKPMNDFSLFDSNAISSLNNNTKGAMFDDLANFGQYSRGDFGLDYLSMRD